MSESPVSSWTREQSADGSGDDEDFSSFFSGDGGSADDINEEDVFIDIPVNFFETD